MTLISKAAGAFDIVSCIYDMHRCGLITSNKEVAKATANTVISNEISTMKMDTFSCKNADIKNWYAKNNLFQTCNETFGSIKGYLDGFFTAGFNYLPNFILSAIAICTKKHKNIANIAAAALGIIEATNFLTNSIIPNKKNDYLNM